MIMLKQANKHKTLFKGERKKMKKLYTVFYEGFANLNLYKTYPQAANRYMRSKIFTDNKDAVAFANEKKTEGFKVEIYNNIGHRVQF